MTRVHLIDGTYELFRSHFGAPPAESASGQEVGATRGLLRSLLALLASGELTHGAVAFDHVVESFRNDLFEGYKTGEGMDEALYAQFPLGERVSRALGLVTWPMVELEADDALASAASRLAEDARVSQVIIASPDKDLAQCVRGTSVVLWDRRRETILDEAGVIEKFGVPPASIPDYLGLVGDSADGIPGVPRWGARSASTLLARYGEITAIPADPSEWDVKVRGAAGLAKSLNEHRPEAALYRALATLRLDAPIDASLEALEWRGADRAELEALAAEIGDMRALDRVAKWR